MSAKTAASDILNPSTYWAGSRCYRVLTPNYQAYSYNYAEDDYTEESQYEDEPECGVDVLHEYDIQKTDHGKYRTAFHVASVYFPYLIGSKGATKKRLENETGCSISIPPRGVVDDIVVTGRRVNQVKNGRLKVELLVEQARKKLLPTHYIEFALNTPEVQEKFLQFKASVLEKCVDSRGVVPAVFHVPIGLHLTLGVLTLVDDYERVTAIEALNEGVQKLVQEFCKERVFNLRIKGLHYMNDEPGEVSILYAGINQIAKDSSEPDDLQNFVDGLVDHLTKSGVMMKTHDRERVKLHMTVMNTKFLRRGAQQEEEDDKDISNESSMKETFDVREILKHFGDYDFGEVSVDSLQLCIRHARDNSATKVVPFCPS